MIGFFAVLLDWFVPYPALLERRIGHPVQWIGSLIYRLEKRLNRPVLSPRHAKFRGVLALGGLVIWSMLVGVMIAAIFSWLPFGWLAEAFLVSVLLAGRQLADMVAKVATVLNVSLQAGRIAVAKIVGRDTAELDEPEISRAAIETLAENASDGFIAPLLFFMLFGLPGILVYKAVNTADSMIGHKSERYLYFGWASARFDDLLNFVPSRLTAMLIVVAAFILPGASGQKAWAAIFDYADLHASPNAGWPEAAFAGALNFGLGGPRSYQGELLDLPPMGEGERELGPNDIGKAVRLYLVMGGLASIAVLAIGLLRSIF